MSRPKTKDELTKHKDAALKKLDSYMTSLIQSNNPDTNSKADKLSYWLETYSNYLDFESSFSPQSLKRYKRGDIIQVNLGYRIGSEEGGLHYAVVIENDNSIHNPIITIIPLTSIKSTKDLNNLRPNEINLGDAIYKQVSAKAQAKQAILNKQDDEIRRNLTNYDKDTISYSALMEQLNSLKASINAVNKINKAISKMRVGSIALVSQITTISKIRIYDPRHSDDVLDGIRLTNEQLDIIDKRIKLFYTKKI